MSNAKFVIQISKGLIREHRARRALMFYSVLAALLLIFFGSTFLWPWLRERPLVFLGYWGLCLWITVLAILLAIYDMAKVRADAVRERRRLAEEYLRKPNDEAPHDPQAR